MSRIPSAARRPGPLSLWDREPEHGPRIVVVPLANPDTARDLLRTASLLVADGDEDDSRLVACVVLMDDRDSEEQREVVEELRALVEGLSERLGNCEMELRTVSAPSVARGVLDTVRDAGADALVMGATTSEDGQLGVSAIGQSILDAVRCDVFVLAIPDGRSLDEVGRVVVAVRDPEVADRALETAARTSRALDRPLEIVHTRGETSPGRQRIRTLVARAGGARQAVITSVPAGRLVARLGRRIDDGDLLVVGYQHGAEGQGWAPESLTRRVLAEHELIALTVARHPAPSSPSEDLLRRAMAWLHPRLTDVEQDSMRDMAEAASRLTLDYTLMIILSGTIAALGLMLDSVAIIIGAMLVAPLMAPMQAFGIALVDGRPAVATRGAVTVLVGSALVIVGAAALGVLVGGPLTPEVLSRGAPSLLDAGVAVAAGTAGAYATARKTIPAALAGVAIAAALVPPLAVVGLAAAGGAWTLALGALLLSTVNILCIGVTSAGVFAWLGLEAHDPAQRRSAGGRWILGAVLAVVLALALSVTLRADRPVLDEARLASSLAEASGGRASLVDTTLDDDLEGHLTVRVVVDVPMGAESGDGAASLEDRLAAAASREIASQLGDEVRVRLVPLPTIAPE